MKRLVRIVSRKRWRIDPQWTVAMLNMDVSRAHRVMYEKRCAICQVEGRNSIEHVPPRSVQAFARASGGTDYQRLRAMPVRNDWHDGDVRAVKTHKSGFRLKSICSECNNALSIPIQRSYLPLMRSLALQAASQYWEGRQPQIVRQDLHDICRVILSMFLSLAPNQMEHPTDDPGMTAQIRAYVQGRTATVSLPFQLRVYRVPRDPSIGTIAGPHAIMDARFGYDHSHLVASEISWFPLGIMLVRSARGVWEDELEPMPDISGWTETEPMKASAGATVLMPTRTSIVRASSPFRRQCPLVIGAWGY